jgi:hypothetical protein
MAQKMAQAGLGPDNLPKNLTPEQVQKMLQQLKDGKFPGGQGQGQGPGQGPGQGEMDPEGGVGGSGGWNEHSEGGGSNGLTWQDPSTKEGVGFEPKGLDSLPDLKNTVKLGESATAPTVDGKATSASSGNGLAQGTQGGGSAARQNVLPRHRKAVDAYFERK